MDVVRWPRLLTPTQLCHLIRQQKNPLRALHLFEATSFRYTSYRHNGPAYAAIIDVLGSAGRLAEMKGVIKQMKCDSCQCRDSVFAGAIRTYAWLGRPEEAVALFRQIPEFNCVTWTESFHEILQILLSEAELEKALQGAFLCYIEAANRLVRSGDGWIITILSSLISMLRLGFGAYMASKGVVEGTGLGAVLDADHGQLHGARTGGNRHVLCGEEQAGGGEGNGGDRSHWVGWGSPATSRRYEAS